MKTIEEMRKTIVEALEDAGFSLFGKYTTYQDGSWYSSYYTKNGDIEHTLVQGYSFTHLNGKCVHLEEVYRSNGTSENRSIRIGVYRWQDSSCQVDKIWKLYGKDGEKKTERILSEVLAEYERI